LFKSNALIKKELTLLVDDLHLLVVRDKDSDKVVEQIFTEYLNSKGHRKTPERYAILDTVYSINGHFDIDSLYSIMKEEGKFSVSRATLYNTITLLIDAQLVIRHQFGNSSQYEKTYDRSIHHHLICTKCGKIIEQKNKQLQKEIEAAEFSKFKVSHYSLYVYGLCEKCIKGNKHNKKQTQ